jgi:hypothetical protein
MRYLRDRLNRSAKLLMWTVGLAASAALAAALWSALEQVPNAHALGWDMARRATLDVRAADALRSGHLLRFLWHVAGPETWPTLRLCLAAPVHAYLGPTAALDVEHGVSIALTAALGLALAFAALAVSPHSGGRALAIFALSAALLLGNRPLRVLSADGMLDVPSAVFTLAACAAWLKARDSSQAHPWLLALCGNLLFHLRWQQGVIFAGTVLVVEGLSDRTAPRAAAIALWRALRSGWAVALAASAVAGGVTAWVASSGGAEWQQGPMRLSVREVYGPFSIAALALFVFVSAALYRARAEFETRLRFLWAWLLTPMVAWLLMPGMRRMRVIGLTSFEYDSGQAPGSLLDRLTFFPSSIWRGWFAGETRWLVLVMVLSSAALAVRSAPTLPGGGAAALGELRSAPVRRALAPFGAMICAELLAYVALNRHNYQERFVLNLAPLLAVCAAAWVLAVPRALAAVAPASAALVLALAAASGWSSPALAAAVSEGFMPAAEGDVCRDAARALPLDDGLLINETGPGRYMLCGLWVELVARERGTTVSPDAARSAGREVLVLEDGTTSADVEGLAPSGEARQFGPVTARRFTVPAATAR